MRKHLNIKVSGEVQGIGFRFSAKILTKKLNITGFIRNEPDGSVYIEAEGEERALEEFMEWCKKGPSFATVEKVEVKEDKLKGFDDFRIT